MDLIISVGIGILIFACLAFGYREGLRLGMRAAKGIEPNRIKMPIEAIKDSYQEHKIQKENDKQNEIYETIEKYDGYTEQEREWMGRANKT